MTRLINRIMRHLDRNQFDALLLILALLALVGFIQWGGEL